MENNIKEICMEFMDIEEGLLYGEINFTFDKLMSAMKAPHPGLIMDTLMVPVFIPALRDEPVDIEAVKKMHEDLTAFSKDFGVKELKKPLKHLKEYIKENNN